MARSSASTIPMPRTLTPASTNTRGLAVAEAGDRVDEPVPVDAFQGALHVVELEAHRPGHHLARLALADPLGRGSQAMGQLVLDLLLQLGEPGEAELHGEPHDGARHWCRPGARRRRPFRRRLPGGASARRRRCGVRRGSVRCGVRRCVGRPWWNRRYNRLMSGTGVASTPTVANGGVGAVRVGNRIGGTVVDSGNAWFDSVNPARPAEVLASLPDSSAAVVDEAVAAAADAQRSWAEVPIPARAELIAAAAEVLAERKAELALLVSREAGKVLVEAGGDVQEAVDMGRFVAGQGRAALGQTVPSELAEQAGVDDPPSRRRGRDDHAVELPGGHPVVEDLPGPAGRQRRRAEAVRAGAVVRRAVRRVPRRGWHPCRAAERGARARRTGCGHRDAARRGRGRASRARCRPGARWRRRPWPPARSWCRSSWAARTAWS